MKPFNLFSIGLLSFLPSHHLWPHTILSHLSGPSSLSFGGLYLLPPFQSVLSCFFYNFLFEFQDFFFFQQTHFFFFVFQDITFANNLNKHFRTLKILSLFFSLSFHPIRNLKFTHWTMNHIQSTENGFLKDAFWITQTCQVCMRFHCCPCSECVLIREWLQIVQSLPVMCMSLFALNCQSHYISLFSATPRHVFSKIPFGVVPNSVIFWYMRDYVYSLPPWSFVKQVQSGIHEYGLKDFFMIFSL